MQYDTNSKQGQDRYASSSTQNSSLQMRNIATCPSPVLHGPQMCSLPAQPQVTPKIIVPLPSDQGRPASHLPVQAPIPPSNIPPASYASYNSALPPQPQIPPSQAPPVRPASPQDFYPQASPMAIDRIIFPEILTGPEHEFCGYCGVALYGPRCGQCRKVNFNRVTFSREQFLSNKWECPSCHFRNVHSNQKCIECGGHIQGYSHYYR